MDRLKRTIRSAYQLAYVNCIENSEQIDQIIGVMTQKLADGLTDAAIYDVGYVISKKIAAQNNEMIANKIIDQIRTANFNTGRAN